jgi:hypothetical protein
MSRKAAPRLADLGVVLVCAAVGLFSFDMFAFAQLNIALDKGFVLRDSAT